MTPPITDDLPAFRSMLDLLHSLHEAQNARQLEELWHARHAPELRVAVFGRFSCGKSTLINSLVEVDREVLTRGVQPTTGQVTRLIFGTDEQVRVWYRDGRVQNQGLEQLQSLSTLDGAGKTPEEIAQIEVAVNSPLLRDNLILIDTPGLGAQADHTRRTQQAIRFADLVLLVLDARHLLTDSERDLSTGWLTQELGKAVLPVVNFLNLVPEENDQHNLHLLMNQWAQASLPKLFEKRWLVIDAKQALLHALGRGTAPTDDFHTLKAWLRSRTYHARLQKAGRRQQLLVELKKAQAANQQLLAQLHTNNQKLQRERTTLTKQLDSALIRLPVLAAAHQSDLARRIQTEMDGALARLTARFQGVSKESLQKNAGEWYGETLTASIQAIDKSGNETLHQIIQQLQIPAEWGHPQPMTVLERMTINNRLSVGELAKLPASDGAVGWGMSLGAAIGTFIIPIPVAGTILGGLAGGWLADWLGQKPPDYAAAYTTQVKTQWKEDAAQVLSIFCSQFQVRVEEMAAQLQEVQSRSKVSLPSSDELRRRQQLAGVFDTLIQQIKILFL